VYILCRHPHDLLLAHLYRWRRANKRATDHCAGTWSVDLAGRCRCGQLLAKFKYAVSREIRTRL